MEPLVSGGKDRAVPYPRVKTSALLLGVCFLGLGTGLQGTLLGLRAGLEGMSEESIGLMMSAFFVGYGLCSILVPHMVTAVGHVRTFAALASIASVAALFHLLHVSAPAWILFRLLNGGCYAGLILIAESWLNSCAEQTHRGRTLAVYNIVLFGSFALSQALINLASPAEFNLFCLVSILLSLSLVPITLSRATVPGTVSASRLGLGRLFAISPLGVCGVFLVGLWMSSFVGMGPLFAHQIGLEEAGVSLLMGIGMAGPIVFQWPLGWFSDRVDRRWIVIFAAGIAGVIGLCIAFESASPSLVGMASLVFVYEGLSIPIYSICVAHVADLISRDDILSAASSLISVYGVGAIFGPFVSGVAMGEMGPKGLFVVSSVLGFAFVGFSLYRLTSREAITKALKRSFVAVPRTSHVILHMDKRRHHRGTV